MKERERERKGDQVSQKVECGPIAPSRGNDVSSRGICLFEITVSYTKSKKARDNEKEGTSRKKMTMAK